MEEGYDVECLGEVSEDLFCMICLKLMKNAVVMKCGHGMCRACFNKLCTSCQERNVSLQCPSCRRRFSSTEVSSIPMIDRIISGLTVKCENSEHGCSWTGKIAEMNTHVAICEYSLVLCPEEPCPLMIPKCMVQDHLANTCLHSRIHCFYHSFGCGMKIVRQAMDDHLNKYSAKHLQLASENLLAKEKEIEALTKENQVLKSELQQTKQRNQKLGDFQIQLQNANEEHKKLSTELENSVSVIASLKEKLQKAILKLEKVDKHLNRDEITGITSTGISEKNVVESIKLAFHKTYDKSKITKALHDGSKSEYLRLSKCLETQVLKGMESLAQSVDTDVKFSSSYWDGFTVSLKHWFKEGILNQLQFIELYCKQLQYLQDNEVNDLIPSTDSIKIEEFHYVRVKYCNTRDYVFFESPCESSCYLMNNSYELKFCLPNAKEVSLLSFKTSQCIKGEKLKDTYVFHLYDDFKHCGNVLLKLKVET